MILILCDGDINSTSFMKYLDERSISYTLITPLKIINEIAIVDNLTSDGSVCIWQYQDLKINFNDVTGLYNSLHYIDIKYFSDFVVEDRAYVQNEWWAYLVYRINDFQNSINPITREVMSGVLYQYPFVYTTAYNNGFKIPKYYISHSIEEIRVLANQLQRYITKNTIYFDNNFKESNSINNDTIGLIEYIDGNVIFVHVVDNKIWTTIYRDGGTYPYKISESQETKCFELIQRLKLRVAELVFKQDANDLVLHYISAFPNWLKSDASYIPHIYKTLAAKLINK